MTRNDHRIRNGIQRYAPLIQEEDLRLKKQRRYLDECILLKQDGSFRLSLIHSALRRLALLHCSDLDVPYSVYPLWCFMEIEYRLAAKRIRTETSPALLKNRLARIRCLHSIKEQADE